MSAAMRAVLFGLFTMGVLASGYIPSAIADQNDNSDDWFTTGTEAVADRIAGRGLHWSGYGEHHFNGTEGTTGEFTDVHRFIFGLNYRFADWIHFGSELEVEHAYVKDGQGEVVLEQFHLDFLLHRALNVRMGRLLSPLSRLNMYHEPPVFHGVERPFYDQYIIPSTWSLDGIGIYGDLSSRISYRAYLTNGLAADGFSASSGIRGGRLKERPGFNQPAFSGRIDVELPSSGRILRMPSVAVAAYTGGAGNTNKGVPSDLDVSVTLFSAEFFTKLAMIELDGAYSMGTIDGAEDLTGGVAEEIIGYKVGAAVNVLPRSVMTGKLEDAALYLFARFEGFNTQAAVPDGVTANDAYDRTALTTGITFHPVPKVALKADYQMLDDDADTDIPARINVGFGWMF